MAFSGTPVSGIFFYLPNTVTRVPLPLLNIKAQATITSTNTHLLLTQTFRVPENTPISTAKYTFPLYAHSAVSSFTAHIGPNKTLHAKIEKKEEARKQFNEAVAAGRTAALMNEVTAEIFTMELGNLPANTEIKVVLGVIGELKSAGEDDTGGNHTLRYTLPMTIAPKYGSPPAELGWNENLYQMGKQGLEIQVEVLSPESIKGISSPTHPISLGFGGQTEDGLQKMSASLSQRQSNNLDKDFVVEMKFDKKSDSVKPWAILEKHPDIEGHNAVMVSFIPRLKLRKVKPEVIFVLDRSGSMWEHMDALKSAMQVFLKSLSAGVKFNICSFGNNHEFMFPDGKSRVYTEGTMEEALKYVSTMSANLGGTELYRALKATLDARDKSSDTEVIVLTDGEIWQTEQVFDLIRQEKGKQAETKKDFRLFSIGLGNGVDRNLVEGMANAGNGYAAFVGENEAFEGKVVKMLKTALSERLLDMQFQLRDENGQIIDGEPEKDDDSDFTIVDTPKTTPPKSPPKKLSLYNADLDSDDELEASPAVAKDTPLKPIKPPNPLRTPYKVNSLLPGQRSIFYFLQAPTPQFKTCDPREVLFTATTSAGDMLELIIPVSKTPKADNKDINTTVHKLAARRLIKEMEQGSTWIDDALSQQLNIEKEDSPSTYKRYVDQQGEAIAMKWQILSKWTSFIIVDDKGNKLEEEPELALPATEGNQRNLERSTMGRVSNVFPGGTGVATAGSPEAASIELFTSNESYVVPASYKKSRSLFGSAAPSPVPAPGSPAPQASFGLFGSRSATASSGLFGSASTTRGSQMLHMQQAPQSAPISHPKYGLFGSAAPPSAAPMQAAQFQQMSQHTPFGSAAPPPAAPMQAPQFQQMSQHALFGSAAPPPAAPMQVAQFQQSQQLSKQALPQKRKSVGAVSSSPGDTLIDALSSKPPVSIKLPSDPKALTLELLKHAAFSGAFTLPDVDLTAFNVSSITSIATILSQKGVLKPDTVSDKDWKTYCDTILVVTILKEKCASEDEVWELVVSKAEDWVEERVDEWGVGENVQEKVWGLVKGVVLGAKEDDFDGVL